MSEVANDPATAGKIICKIDGAAVHSVQVHIKQQHPGWTIERYQKEFPGEPILSNYAKELIEKRKASAATAADTAAHPRATRGFTREPMAKVFGLGGAKAALNAKGEPIMVKVMSDTPGEYASLIPDVDPNYIFDIEVVKNILIGMELGMAAYSWGYHGTGKTTGFEQVCARTKRPFLRVQHTVNMEERDVLGQWTVRDGETIFQLGPLPEAMLNGLVYCADEYDVALPSVIALYQPVLEGKPLVIKDAPPELRVIRPHPDFRFCATGNTNGCGDETGLYQGTQIQNAANYSRFGITQEIGYMEPKIETTVVAGQSGIDQKDAAKLVSFAKEIRDAFKNGKMGSTISPRELITAGKLGLVRGAAWRTGLRLAFTARLSRVDKEVAEQFAQRIFGGE